MTYKTSLDNAAKIITIIITILFATILARQYSLIKDAGNFFPTFTTVVILVIYFLSFSFRPISYLLTDKKLIIHRFFSDIKIDINKIASVEHIDRSEIGFAIRTFAVDGLFGYFGKYFSFKIGRLTYYATRRDSMVLITTIDNKKIILTPNDPSKFIKDLKQ